MSDNCKSCNCDDVQITALENGPVLVMIGEKKIALCRCGDSLNKPFCDGAHANFGFKGGTVEVWPELTTTEAPSAA